jgi:hypothetical protein
MAKRKHDSAVVVRSILRIGWVLVVTAGRTIKTGRAEAVAVNKQCGDVLDELRHSLKIVADELDN